MLSVKGLKVKYNYLTNGTARLQATERRFDAQLGFVRLATYLSNDLMQYAKCELSKEDELKHASGDFFYAPAVKLAVLLLRDERRQLNEGASKIEEETTLLPVDLNKLGQYGQSHCFASPFKELLSELESGLCEVIAR